MLDRVGSGQPQVPDSEQGKQRGRAQYRRNCDVKDGKRHHLPTWPMTFDLRVSCGEPNHSPPAAVKPAAQAGIGRVCVRPQ
jgi:hypothetical protein